MVRTSGINRRTAVLTTTDINSDSWIYVPTVTTNSVTTTAPIATPQAYDTIGIHWPTQHRGEFRTTCKCCGGLMPKTEEELNTCPHCGATQNTFEKE